MLKNIGLPAACLGVFLLFGAASAAEMHDLMTCQLVVVGTVTVESDADYLYVTLKTTGNRAMTEAHLHVLDEKPARRLDPRLACYRSDYIYSPQYYGFVIPLEELGAGRGNAIHLQVHASVDGQDACGGEIVRPEHGDWFGSIEYWFAGDIIPVTWVDIPESNADFPAENCPDGVGFTGEMSRHPITNAQYAQYLNAAIASGHVEVDGHQVRGATGDYAGHGYYRLNGRGQWADGPTDWGAARIKHTGDTFSVDRGFENHPVTYVSWYGAAAFAGYYGWRLPTEWEWESVANYNDHRRYATGLAPYGSEGFLANYRANGWDDVEPNNLPYHPYVEHGTTPVGHFGYHGYGLADMTGNVFEWTGSGNRMDPLPDGRALRVRNRPGERVTDSVEGKTGYVYRGGCWVNSERHITVSRRRINTPELRHPYFGFRVCR